MSAEAHLVPLQYGEFRVGFNKDVEDTRVVSYGIRWLIDHYISKQWTQHDIDCAEIFYRYAFATHHPRSSVGSPYRSDLYRSYACIQVCMTNPE